MPTARIISIGALPAHPLWNERQPVRVGHATTTLVRAGNAHILVDPGLPESVVVARLAERTGLSPRDITHVFLTSFHPDARRGIEAFDNAVWLISAAEREAVGVPMASALRHALESENPELREQLERDVAVLQACQPAPDSLADGVDLFPLHGCSPGLTGLLLEQNDTTTLICGDAVATIEHIEQSKVLPWAADLRQAKASFAEALEIADYLIPGRDNLAPSPGARQANDPNDPAESDTDADNDTDPRRPPPDPDADPLD